MSGSDRAEARDIVVVLHDFYAGGAERVAVTLANTWRAMGRNVTLLCGSEEGPFRSRVDPRVRVATVQPPVPQGQFSRIRLGLACARALRRLRPDVVFAPGNFHLPVIGIAARARYADRPVFACKLSNRLRRPGRSWFAQAIFNATTRIWAARLDGIVAMSPNLRAEARALLHRCPVGFVWEPCITEDTATTASQDPDPETLRILVVGRLVAEKNVSLALRAFAAFKERRTATLQILGDGPLRSRLEAESRKLGIAGQIQFVGHVGDTRPYFANAHALLSTSRYEGYPAVIIEALAAGIPVVATDSSPALSEMLFDRTFGSIAAATPGALADALELALRQRPSPTALSELVARHVAERSARAYLEWFDDLHATHGGGGRRHGPRSRGDRAATP